MKVKLFKIYLDFNKKYYSEMDYQPQKRVSEVNYGNGVV